MKRTNITFDELISSNIVDVSNLKPVELRRRRNFNTREREALFILYGGICAICNDILSADWEPDHKIPFSAGGATDVTNGQPLCKRCNRKKGGATYANS